MSSPPENAPPTHPSAEPPSEATAGTVPPLEGGTKPPATTPTFIQADAPAQLTSNMPTSAFATPAASADFTPGSVLGPYELMEKLGQGGMGAVYKARHQHLDMLVALKVLPQQFTQHPESVSRFKREMKAVGRIRHANIVQAMDAGEINGTQYLAMEYIEGSDLAKLVATKGVFSPTNACKAVKQAAQALSAAHAAGLVHRDIKPSNLLLAKSGQIKILDLGLALLGEDSGQTSEVTAHGQTFGTPDYMAPEQWADSHAVDARTDLYALGCTLFYLLVGRAPYSDDKHRTPLNKMTGHVMDPIPDLKAIRTDVPDPVIVIYRKLMAKKPEERYQSAAELVEALNRFAAGKSLPEETSLSTPVASSVLSVDATLSNSSPSGTDVEPAAAPTMLSAGAIVHSEMPTQRPRNQRAASRRRPWWVFLLASALLVCIAGGLYVAFTSRGEPQQPVAGVTPSNGSSTDSQPTGWHGWPADAPKPAIAPFDAEQAKKHQEEWAAYLKIPIEYTNSIGMKFMLIPPGEFTMGSTAEEIAAGLKDIGQDKHWQECIQSEAPQHKVILTQPIYLSVNEITQAEYEQVMDVNPSHFAAMGAGKESVAGMETVDHPVEMVSWYDAAGFCAKLSKQEKLKLDGTGYRLPSEAEWEFACRAGTVTKYWIGDQDEDLVRAGWFGGNAGGRTHAAGELKTNPFGLDDIHGNVWEWVEDSWDASYYGQFSEKPAINPNSPFSAGSQRVIRGGRWHDAASTCRSSIRGAYDPEYRGHNVGFRVSLTVDTVRQALKQQQLEIAAKTGWHGWPADAPKPAIAPFDAAQAKRHQEEWAAYLKVPVEWENSLGMKFRLIPPGEFLMGSTPEEIDEAIGLSQGNQFWKIYAKSEGPKHQVVLSQPFYLGVHEVTQDAYATVNGKRPFHFSINGAGKDRVAGFDTNQFPAETVDWCDATDFCARLSTMEHLRPSYLREENFVASLSGSGYRLPTEAEWEFSCRAGSPTRYWPSDSTNELPRVGWVDSNSAQRPHTVGELEANPFGLFDVHGNVFEWVQDGWDPEYYAQYESEPAIDPKGFADLDALRVIKGGYSKHHLSYCRMAFRHAHRGTLKNPDIGFRVALPVDAVKQALQKRANTNWHGWPADAPKPAIAPFDAEQARKHQEEWAAYLKVPVEWENSIGMKFRLVPPGEFTMGTTQNDADKLDLEPEDHPSQKREGTVRRELPAHQVVLTQPMYLATCEVTQGQFQTITGNNPSAYAATGKKAKDVTGYETLDHPADSITALEAFEFCRKLSLRENLSPYDNSLTAPIRQEDAGYRLPSEAAWEFAHRAGAETRYWFGDQPEGLAITDWTYHNSKYKTHPVGTLQPNPLGFFDLAGNVSEWCDRRLTYKPGRVVNPVARSEDVFAIRGGNWWTVPFFARAAYRTAGDFNRVNDTIGLRVSLPVEIVKKSVTKVPVSGWQNWPADAPKPAIAPFAADEAKKYQEAWAAYLKTPVEWENSIGMKFRLIPPGEFRMGMTRDEEQRLMSQWSKDGPVQALRASPAHTVILTQPFYLGMTEVSQEHYETVAGNNPSYFSPAGEGKDKLSGADSKNHPVEQVSCFDAAGFCLKLSQRHELKDAYFIGGETIVPLPGNGFRLPTEAEWEWACRAGTTTAWFMGEDEAALITAGWFGRNAGGMTHPVAQLKSNPFGLFDMHGNVWELCQDWYDPEIYAQRENAVTENPVGPPAGKSYIMRGGNWFAISPHARSEFRYSISSRGRQPVTGFRITLPVDAVRELTKKSKE